MTLLVQRGEPRCPAVWIVGLPRCRVSRVQNTTCLLARGTHVLVGARKTARIAGARVLEDLALAVPGAAERFATSHPADDDEVATALVDILVALATATWATTPAPGDDDTQRE